MPDQEMTYDVPEELNEVKFVREGYEFSQWLFLDGNNHKYFAEKETVIRKP